MSLFYLFVARGGRNRGKRRTDGRTTVTLAAHARLRLRGRQRKCWSKVIHNLFLLLGLYEAEWLDYSEWGLHLEGIFVCIAVWEKFEIAN